MHDRGLMRTVYVFMGTDEVVGSAVMVRDRYTWLDVRLPNRRLAALAMCPLSRTGALGWEVHEVKLTQ